MRERQLPRAGNVVYWVAGKGSQVREDRPPGSGSGMDKGHWGGHQIPTPASSDPGAHLGSEVHVLRDGAARMP